MAKFPGQINVQEANIAIAAFSRSVEMADGDQSSQIDALLSRTTLYNLLKKPFEAVADAEAAEKLGSLDLSSIVSIEATAFITRGTPEDHTGIARRSSGVSK